ncbi:MAG: iron ABC transporter permease [Firmicutes bacterium]|nr:iron ABC transporter permease [Bacillota bacterium]
MSASSNKGGLGVQPSTAASPAGRRINLRKYNPLALSISVILWAVLGLFILYPLYKLLHLALIRDGALKFDSIARILSRKGNRLALYNSLKLGVFVACLSTFIGFIFAFARTRANLARGWRWFIDAIIILPLISPPFTLALGMLFAFGPTGVLTYKLLGIQGASIYGMWSTISAETLTYFPLAYMTLVGVLENINPSLEENAFSMGGSRLHVFRTISLPLSIPGIANSLLLVFSASLADFATPLVLAGHQFPILPTQAYLQITGLFDLRGGAALSFILLVPSLLIFILQHYWVSRKHYVTVTGKASSGTPTRLVSPGARYLLLFVCLAMSAFVLFLYGMIVFGSLVKAWGANHEFTLVNYRYLFTHGLKSIKDTLFIAFIAMPAGGLLGLIIGYLVTRQEIPGKRLMEFVSLINYALPGTVVGIAYLLAFNDPPIMLTGTATILIAAYVFRYSPTGLRATIATLQQIDKSIEEASTSLGANMLTTLRKITVPLILPSLFAGLEVTFTRAMTAISATIFLISVNWTLITVRILESATELELGNAAAFSVFVILTVYLVTNALRLVLRLLGLTTLQEKTALY